MRLLICLSLSIAMLVPIASAKSIYIRSRFNYHFEVDKSSLPKGVESKVEVHQRSNRKMLYFKNTNIEELEFQKRGSIVKLANSEVYLYTRNSYKSTVNGVSKVTPKGWRELGTAWHNVGYYIDDNSHKKIREAMKGSRQKNLPKTTKVPESIKVTWPIKLGGKEVLITGKAVFSINDKYDLYSKK